MEVPRRKIKSFSGTVELVSLSDSCSCTELFSWSDHIFDKLFISEKTFIFISQNVKIVKITNQFIKI